MADLLTTYIGHFGVMLVGILCVVVVLLISMAYLTYYERKVLAAAMLRKGPNVTGPFGLLQPMADGLKLFLKETIIPTGSNPVLFLLAPVLTFGLALVGWSVIPFGPGLVISNINVGILYLFAISSLGVYGIIIAGWASNSRYAFLGPALLRFVEPQQGRRGAEPSLVLYPAVPDDGRFLRLGSGRNEQGTVRSGRERVGTGCRLLR